MDIVFFGTPEYVVPILETLHRKFKNKSGDSPIASVVTQEPKVVGRKHIKSFSPVDNWAYKHKVPIFFEPKEIIKKGLPADIGVLASYGKIIPQEVIEYFKYGIINIHPSLLPLWRGASPVQASITSGEKITGITFIKLDKFLDHGPIISQFKEEIKESDTTESLRNRLFSRAAQVIPNLIKAYIVGKIRPQKQDEKLATFTRQLKKDDAFISPFFLESALAGKTSKRKWLMPFIKRGDKPYNQKPTAENLYNFIRAMYPWPMAWTYILTDRKNTKDTLKKRLKIISSRLEKNQLNRYCLILETVQLEGKSPVSWKQFCEGYPNFTFQINSG